MPMYTISSATPLAPSLRQPLAEKVMRVHCDLTGAPETFVQVVYSSGVPLNTGQSVHVFGNVRKGRTDDANKTLSDSLKQAVAELAGCPLETVQVELFEVPASWVMEGGEVLPEPGEEANCDWLSAPAPNAQSAGST